MIMYSHGRYLPKTVHDHGTNLASAGCRQVRARFALDHAAGQLTGQVIHVNGGAYLGR
jgi:hypothetical protein